jgi:Ca2+-binding EF-hand superfamily protein
MVSACQELQREDSFDNYNPEDNDYVTNDDFTNVFSKNNYNDWDIDKDEIVNNEELYRGFYKVWDVNNDEKLNEKEWAHGTENYLDNFKGKRYGYFSDWDLDSDDWVEVEEFVNAIADTPYYSAWDKDNDNELDPDEFGEGVFRIFDENEDERISRKEFQEWSPKFEL